MTHYHEFYDAEGNLADTLPFCSDNCHREWHLQRPPVYEPYEGWNGAHEGPDYNEYCAQCGVIASTGEDSCEHQRENVVVNRFLSADGEACEHGNWVQLPERMIRQ